MLLIMSLIGFAQKFEKKGEFKRKEAEIGSV